MLENSNGAPGPSAARGDGLELELVRRLSNLYVAVVADCLDQLGFRDRLMDPHIRPLEPDSRLAGYAATFQLTPSAGVPDDSSRWYEGELAAIEALQPADVIVAGGSRQSFWGELLATATLNRGGHGVVADAYTRDTRALRAMGFPTFVAGIHAADSLGRVEVAEHNVPVECGGVLVHPGDLVLADCDGVVVVPHMAGEEALRRAEEKVASENGMRVALQEGMRVTEAFARFKVL